MLIVPPLISLFDILLLFLKQQQLFKISRQQQIIKILQFFNNSEDATKRKKSSLR